MTDPTTLAVYASKADDYAQMFHSSRGTDPALLDFMAELTDNAKVLDLGCGPGKASGIMAAAGFRVTAVDAVSEMVALAAQNTGVVARQQRFDELSDQKAYHGIWANFSLLHVPRSEFPDVLGSVVGALKPGGVLHIGMKLGDGEHRDALGRLYAYYTEDELRGYLAALAMKIVAVRRGSGQGLDGSTSDWISLRAHA